MNLILKVVLFSTLMLSNTFLYADDSLSHASPEWQISAYSGAAPSFIGDFATIVGGLKALRHRVGNRAKTKKTKVYFSVFQFCSL